MRDREFEQMSDEHTKAMSTDKCQVCGGTLDARGHCLDCNPQHKPCEPEPKRGGCGKPGHVTAGSDEGTQWCATCVTEGEALAPWHFIDREEHADVFSGGMFMAKCRSALAAREIVEGMNARVKLRRQLSEAHNKNCKLQDDVAAIVSSHRLDWSWNDVLSDVRALQAKQQNARSIIAALRDYVTKQPLREPYPLQELDRALAELASSQPHIPQVPGQFTEGDPGLPEEWRKLFADNKEVWTAMKKLGIREMQQCPGCHQLWVNLNDRNCRKCGARMVTVESVPVPKAGVH